MQFHYKQLTKFSAEYFKNILRPEHLQREMALDGIHYWELLRDKKRFLIGINEDKDLPIRPTKTERIEDSKILYNQVKGAKSIKIRADKTFTFREIVDKMCPFKHSSTKDFLMWKILCLGSYVNRVYFAVSTTPAFGKNSILDVMKFLTNDVECFSPKSTAAAEYRLTNRILGLNELSDLDGGEQKNMQQFLLNTCDDRHLYEKSTRGSASHKTSDRYDISSLSVIIIYNYITDYVNPDKFFDNMFNNAILDRILRIKLEGNLNISQFNIDSIALEKYPQELFIGLMRSLQWYKLHWSTEIKKYAYKPSIKLKGRHLKTFNRLLEFISLYSNNENEYIELAEFLAIRIKEYKDMIEPKDDTLKAYEETVEDST